MNLTTHSEIIRLIVNEPLTLSCSALADFLWEDFIRDARPSVTYLIDSYNIKIVKVGFDVFGYNMERSLLNSTSLERLRAIGLAKHYNNGNCDFCGEKNHAKNLGVGMPREFLIPPG